MLTLTLTGTPNSTPFPANRDTSNIEPWLIDNGRVVCGPVETYYPETDEWTTISDFDTVPPTVGGCSRDLALGYCLERPLIDTSSGCALFVEETLVASISTIGVMLVVLTAINVYTMLLSCCMWWKRKETDVFPNFEVILDQTGKSDFSKILNQFEVKPQYEILSKRNFLPMPKLLKLELARVAKEEETIKLEKAAEQAAFEDEV